MQPSAFLNYILFDKNYKVVTMGWQQIPAGSFTQQKVSIQTITAQEAGYIFVYLSYEDLSNNYVYFDDFKVTYTPNNIVQANEYYPFGMQTVNSWTRPSTVSNTFLANGGTELNTTSSLYDLEFRNYDPALARMHQVDPMAVKYSSHSPYQYSFNNPVSVNDPNGADPFWIPSLSDMSSEDFLDPWRNHGGGDLIRNVGGGGQVKPSDFGGYYVDQNNNGIQDANEETYTGWNKVTTWYSQETKNYTNGRYDYSDYQISSEVHYEYMGNSVSLQNGPPTIFVNMDVTPKGFDVEKYMKGLKSALIQNGFSKNLVIKRTTFSGIVEAWLNNSPTATVTIKNFRLDGQDPIEAGGYAKPNDPNSIVIYNGLSATGAGIVQDLWQYINTSIHEVGHALFGFYHDSDGFTNDPSSIMDYRSSHRFGAGFNSNQKIAVLESIWGNF